MSCLLAVKGESIPGHYLQYSTDIMAVPIHFMAAAAIQFKMPGDTAQALMSMCLASQLHEVQAQVRRCLKQRKRQVQEVQEKLQERLRLRPVTTLGMMQGEYDPRAGIRL